MNAILMQGKLTCGSEDKQVKAKDLVKVTRIDKLWKLFHLVLVHFNDLKFDS